MITFEAFKYAVDTAQNPIRRSDLEREIGIEHPKVDGKLLVTQLLSEEILVKAGVDLHADYTSEACAETLQQLADVSEARPRPPPVAAPAPVATPRAAKEDAKDWWPLVVQALHRRQLSADQVAEQLGDTKGDRADIRGVIRQGIRRGDLLRKSSGKLVPRERPDPDNEPPDVASGAHLRKVVQMLAYLSADDVAKAARLAEKLRKQRDVIAAAQADERAILAEAEKED